ncbi:dynein-related subfamily AAA family protein [Palleronia aestuarii]|uniref:Dynein-related subfamily AAA family protein n=1 Tax=Palleronia aestuarii TaxID=568105 RepID=A0A2W7NBY3_9RHOB|nr:AAA family ATPase [Palleronia aestuarii]PZX17490.1 dynein-related subfamily AAA family protein [Palleronia aestuarii]
MMSFAEALECLRSACMEIDGKPPSTGSSRKSGPNPGATAPGWYLDVADEDRGETTREIAYLLAYVRICGKRFPLHGIQLRDGWMWPDRAVIRKLSRHGSVSLTSEGISLTPAGRRKVERWLGPEPRTDEAIRIPEAVLDRWIARLRAAYPGFETFNAPCKAFDDDERGYKLRTAEALQAALSHPSREDQVAGILKALQGSNLLNWRVTAPIKSTGNAGRAATDQALLDMASSAIGPPTRHGEALALFVEIWTSNVPGSGQRDAARQIAELLLMHLAPSDGIYIRATVRDDFWREATGERFPTVESPAENYRLEFGFMQAVRRAFEVRGLAPRDFIDVQSALWVIHNHAGKDAPEFPKPEAEMEPTNLILYGPPGTGKTHETAAEAVRLCGEAVPDDREALMTTYRRLCAEKRIEFVTFHQSVSYEDFVEGLRPETGSTDVVDESGNPGAGFSLVPRPGIFRTIATRAGSSSGRSSPDNAIRLGDRRVFKMSMGEAANPEHAAIFDDAISGNYVVAGWADIDWSDAAYSERSAILERLREEGIEEGKLTALSGWVQTPNIFRNGMRTGDIVIVSKGNSLFRAIGEVTGDYKFHPREEGDYGHRRAVRWPWVDRTGVPVNEVYAKTFIMKTVYQLTESDLNAPALERYMNSQATAEPGPPESFVLIVDEINRANISKVFGELITLIEPDKRLGRTNELKVRLPYSGEDFGVPANLHILGTMNTADRSIALLDTALRRRFEFREMMPLPDELKVVAGIDLPRLLKTLNERIEYLYDREHQIGHAYFIGCTTRDEIDVVMRHKVIPLLAEYFFEDWGKVAAVLGDAAPEGSAPMGGFLRREALSPPPGLDADGDGASRYRWTVREDGFDYARLAGA